MHQWLTDSGLTPQIMVDATAVGVDIPPEHIREGHIVLNISLSATRQLDLGNDQICFEARFAGVSRILSFPVSAVESIYAQETGVGLVFPPEVDYSKPTPLDALPDPPVSRPKLSIVK